MGVGESKMAGIDGENGAVLWEGGVLVIEQRQFVGGIKVMNM